MSLSSKVLIVVLFLAIATSGLLFYTLQNIKTTPPAAPAALPTPKPTEAVTVENPFTTQTANPFATTSATANPFEVSPTKAQEYTNPFDALR
ncbi:hypothetical protein HY358_00230 [Candidatus Roizmanbacteria bacterium]|nr:hypothetical protein [Candidatus Roizmanbacteria bacterium]